MDAEVEEVVVRFHGRNFLRGLDANGIVNQLLDHFPKLTRILFEYMSDQERFEASSVDRDRIVHVHNRCFVYGKRRGTHQRLVDMERIIEKTNV